VDAEPPDARGDRGVDPVLRLGPDGRGARQQPRADASLKAQFIELKDGDALFDQVAAGTLDAMLFDSRYVRWRARHDPGLRIVGEPPNRLGYHVGVLRSDPELLKRVNAAIQKLQDSGDLARIRWKSEGDGK
jgi:ABC-type amino acid transport substrate-binding protein